MTWFSDLVERAGFGSQWRPIAVAMALGAAFVFALIELATSITGLALAGSVLTVAFALELLRLVASRRQLALTQSWPAVMDSLRSGAQAGMGTWEQIEDLGERGPLPLRKAFQQLGGSLDSGSPMEKAIASFRTALGSRIGDRLAMTILVISEMGGRKESEVWERMAQATRKETSALAIATSKQSWVSLSAKIALLAPWLLAAVLLRVEQNRLAYDSLGGTMVLIFGLLVSALAYFLTSILGRIPEPGRVFDAG